MVPENHCEHQWQRVASLVGYCSPDSESEAASLTRVARAARVAAAAVQ